MTCTDEQLCHLAQGGDIAARDRLIARYIDTVGLRARGYISGAAGEVVEFEDLGQEGFIGLFSAINSYDASLGASFRTYAILNIDRRITDAVRFAFRKKQVPASAKVELDDLPDSNDPEHVTIVKDELNRVMSRLEQETSTLERSVFTLHLDGYSYSEIAKRLGCSTKSVENALTRVRRKLSNS